MKTYIIIFFIIILIITIIPSLISCFPKKQGGDELEAPAATKVKNRINPTQNIISKNELKRTDTNTKKENIIKLKEVKDEKLTKSYTIGSKRHLTLLPGFPNKEITPEDFKIGKLHNLRKSTNEQNIIVTTIDNFFKTLLSKKIDKNLLTSENSELNIRLTYYIDRGNIPTSFRVGKIIIENINISRAYIRLFGNKGISEGEVYLKKQNGNWKISDIQIDFNNLSIEYIKKDEKYMPSIYSSIINGI